MNQAKGMRRNHMTIVEKLHSAAYFIINRVLFVFEIELYVSIARNHIAFNVTYIKVLF